MPDLTIKQKLLSALGALTVLSISLAVASIYRTTAFGNTIHHLGVDEGNQSYLAGLADASGSEMVAAQRGVMVQAATGNWAMAEKRKTQFTEQETILRKALKDLRAGGVSARGTIAINKIEASLEGLDPIYARFISAIDAHDVSRATEINLGELGAAIQDLDDLTTETIAFERETMGEANTQAQNQVLSAMRVSWILLIVVLAVSCVIVRIVINLERQLRKNVIELNQGSEQIATAAEQIASSSQVLARESSNQAAMIEETSSSSAEISSMAKRNADNARVTTGIVGNAVMTAQQSRIAVDECVQSIMAIDDSSGKIAKIIDVIDKISFQTNILALNAAVEAARAGNAGSGFAVVAEEVRNLAQRSAEAAKETSALIGTALANAADGREKIRSVVSSEEHLESAFGEIKTLVENIGGSSSEQLAGVQQIAQAISRMEQTTQTSAANAEESAAAAQQLHAQSDALRLLAARLGKMVGFGNDVKHQPMAIRPIAGRSVAAHTI